jgi:hypothetical protein
MTNANTPRPPLTSPRTGRLVCYKCRSGYASDFDYLCTPCRSPKRQWITAWQARKALAELQDKIHDEHRTGLDS